LIQRIVGFQQVKEDLVQRLAQVRDQLHKELGLKNTHTFATIAAKDMLDLIVTVVKSSLWHHIFKAKLGDLKCLQRTSVVRKMGVLSHDCQRFS
jgi:hypothetical protein